MALVIEMNPAAPNVIASKRLWLTADRNRVVKEGDREAAFLLAAVGQEIPRAEAERLGLVEPHDQPKVPGSTIPKSEDQKGGLTITLLADTATTEEAQEDGTVGEAETGEETEESENGDESDAPAESATDDLEALSFRELQEHCKEAGLSAFGNTETLTKRLRDAQPGKETKG